MLPIINKNLMLFDIEAGDKMDLIKKMVEAFDKEGYLSDKEQFFQDVLEREKVFSTYIDYGIGIPHGKSSGVKEAGVCIARLPEKIQWGEEEEEQADLLIMIAVRNETDNNLHMQILAQLSRNLMHEDFREKMKHGDKESIYEVLEKEVGGN